MAGNWNGSYEGNFYQDRVKGLGIYDTSLLNGCTYKRDTGYENRVAAFSREKTYVNVIGKGIKIRTLYLLPKTVAHIEKYLYEFHGESPEQKAYLFYSRTTGIYGKMSQPAVDKFLKKYIRKCCECCPDIPLNLHAHMFRHAKASHWLEDGINIVQISFLLGHENLQTTMAYLNISTKTLSEALATLEEEKDKAVIPKWKNADGSLIDFCSKR